jgi:hypothetical protein
MEHHSGILTAKSNMGPREGTRDQVKEDTTWPIISTRPRVHDSGVVARGRAGTIPAARNGSDPFDLREPLLRCFDHLPEALQDIRVEDRPQRAAIARDLDLQLVCFVHRA